MIDFEALLAGVIGHAPPDGLAEAMAEILPRYEINTPLRIAHFIGQTAEETGGYRYLHELGGPDYFARYEGRADLGNTEPGDGERFKGRGLLQITGRANYARIGQEIRADLIRHPEFAEHVDVAVETACLYWRDHNLNALADQDNIVAITKRVNGGLNGFSVRKAYTAKANALLDQLAQQAPIPAPVAAPEPAPVPVAPEQPAPVLSDPAGSDNAPDFTPLWRDLLTMARDRIASFGGGGAVIGASALAWIHKLSAADAILLVGAGLFVLVLVLWLGSRKEHRQQAEKLAALNAQPPGPKPELTDAQVAAFKAFLSALESRGQAA